jgi:AcrR family transcriptional regulator
VHETTEEDPMPRRPKDDPTAPELDRARIVRAAIDLIDVGGLDDFSLRAVARRLGAGNMSVYHYVKDRDELLALVLDEVLGTIGCTASRTAPSRPSVCCPGASSVPSSPPGDDPVARAAARHDHRSAWRSTVRPVFVGLLRGTGLTDARSPR